MNIEETCPVKTRSRAAGGGQAKEAGFAVLRKENLKWATKTVSEMKPRTNNQKKSSIFEQRACEISELTEAARHL